MIQILFALLAGVLTIAAPCILPMLPILLGASVGHTSRQRPLFIVLGFIVSFAAASLVLSAIVTHLGLSPNALRDIAVVLLFVFAVFMIWPKPFELLTVKLSGTINQAGKMGQGTGNMSGLILGLVLGIIWTPCAGPILGAILTLIATQGTTGRSAILLIAYALGAGIPMLIIAYGSQYITTKVRAIAKYSVRIQQVFGVLVLLLAIAMYFQYDVAIVNKLTAYFPQSSLEQKLVGENSNNQSNQTASSTNPIMENIEFSNYGKAPEFTGIDHWLNSSPLTMSQLKGKVVLVDFWTFSCINCIRTLPYVTKWYDTYQKDGLVVVGVHTPEFAFEKDTGNVQNAINQFKIHYPVAQDNEYGTWQAFNNEYWPAEYLIDQKGNIVYEHFGEGEYDHTENAIRELLGLNNPVGAENGQDLSRVNSPEMYFGTARLEYLTDSKFSGFQKTMVTASQQVNPVLTFSSLPDFSELQTNTFAFKGNWQFFPDNAQCMKDCIIRLKFSSGKVYMVAASDKPVTLKILVDGVAQPNVTVQASELYNLFNSTSYTGHTLEIDIPDAGLQAFTFTFG